MKDRLFQANREGRLRTVDVTKDIIKEIWDQIAIGDELGKLVESMPRRIQAVINYCRWRAHTVQILYSLVHNIIENKP